MVCAIRVGLVSILALLALPAAANAANVTVSGGTLTYNAAAGETNTAVIVKQQTTAVATVYFVGDQNPAVTVTASRRAGLPADLAGPRPARRATSAPSPSPPPSPRSSRTSATATTPA